jgi:hypothetical protein
MIAVLSGLAVAAAAAAIISAITFLDRKSVEAEQPQTEVRRTIIDEGLRKR